MSTHLDDDDTLSEAPVGIRRPLHALDWSARSTVGLVRSSNEDAWGESDDRIFAVADGMGGTAGGARASALAVASFISADPSRGWLRALAEVNATVRLRCDEEGFPQAGTTLVGLVVEAGRCITLSLGDSRIYRLRDGSLRLLTTDHNIRTLRIEEGLDPSGPDARGKPAALTSYIGNTDTTQRADVGTVSARAGDRFLLCSDGVFGQLPDDDIAGLLAEGDCELAATRLVEAADRAGGRDNATALVVELGKAVWAR